MNACILFALNSLSLLVLPLLNHTKRTSQKPQYVLILYLFLV